MPPVLFNQISIKFDDLAQIIKKKTFIGNKLLHGETSELILGPSPANQC